MKLSVLIPLFNEEQTIKIILEKLLKQKSVSEIIIVDDFSDEKSFAKKIVVESLNESKLDDIKQALHTETDKNKAKKLKIEIGKMFQEKGAKDQEDAGNTTLKAYRKDLGYTGDLIGVYDKSKEYQPESGRLLEPSRNPTKTH
mgnify:CR=1 FL=1